MWRPIMFYHDAGCVSQARGVCCAKCGNKTLLQRVCLAKLLCQYPDICNTAITVRRSFTLLLATSKTSLSRLAFSLNKERKQRASRRERERSLRFNSCMNTAAQQSRAARLQNRGRTSTPPRERASASARRHLASVNNFVASAHTSNNCPANNEFKKLDLTTSWVHFSYPKHKGIKRKRMKVRDFLSYSLYLINLKVYHRIS